MGENNLEKARLAEKQGSDWDEGGREEHSHLGEPAKRLSIKNRLAPGVLLLRRDPEQRKKLSLSSIFAISSLSGGCFLEHPHAFRWLACWKGHGYWSLRIQGSQIPALSLYHLCDLAKDI